MKRLLPLLFALSFVGCGSALSSATVAVNDARIALSVAHDTIAEACVPAYAAAKSPEDVARVDKVCQPARKAYRVARASWMAAVAAVQAARVGDDRQLLPAWQRLAGTIGALAVTVAEVSP